MKKLLLIALSIVAAISTTAHADLLTSEQDYFHCDPAESTPVGNVNIVTDANRPSWNTAAPTASIADPTLSKCGFVTAGTFAGANYQSIYDLMAAGTFNGNLDSLTMTFYAAFAGTGYAVFSPVPPPVIPNAPQPPLPPEPTIPLPPEPALPSPAPSLPPYPAIPPYPSVPASPQAPTSLQAAIHVGVDGQSMFGEDSSNTTGTPAPSIKRVDLEPQATATPGVYKFELSVTGLNFLSDDSAEHDVELTMNVWSEVFGYYPIDTVETPAGVSFNQESLAAVSVQATTPNKD